ncbi:MAG: S-layer homology domain-containing protein [Oscillospiraceae bacterium]|nr:S-layer homology domain-containing protein [Oscillospiraceae bacterium]
MSIQKTAKKSIKTAYMAIICVLLACVFVISSAPAGNTAHANTTSVTVSNAQQLTAALDNPAVSVITLTADIGISPQAARTFRRDLTLLGNHMIYHTIHGRTDGGSIAHVFLSLYDGVRLVIDGPRIYGSIVVGRYVPGAANVPQHIAEVVLENGAVMGYLNSAFGSTVTINNGNVRRHWINGTTVMNGGTIVGADAVIVSAGGHFTMNSGSIRATGSGVNGYGVQLLPDSVFIMNGGSIHGDTAGVAFRSHYAGGFEWNAGTITGGGGAFSNHTTNQRPSFPTPTGPRQPNQGPSQEQPPTTAPNLSTASNWAHDGINNAVAVGLVPQSLQNHFTNNITRSEFTALAVALYETVTGTEITGRMQFNDTTDINVQKMGYLGVVSGVGDGNFAPNSGLTREQAAVMLARLADVIGQPLPPSASTFVDNAQMSSWAVIAVGQMQATGIMGGVGDNRFSPRGSYTREQSIVTILRLFDLLD